METPATEERVERVAVGAESLRVISDMNRYDMTVLYDLLESTEVLQIPRATVPNSSSLFAFSAQWTVTMDPGWSPSPLQPVPQHSHFGGTAPFGTAGADLHDLQVINYARCFACYLIKSDKQKIFWHFRVLAGSSNPTHGIMIRCFFLFGYVILWSDRPDPSLLPRTQRRLVWLGTPIHQVVPSLFMFI